MMSMMLMMKHLFRLGHPDDAHDDAYDVDFVTAWAPDDVDDAHDDAYDEKYTILTERLRQSQMMLLPKSNTAPDDVDDADDAFFET